MNRADLPSTSTVRRRGTPVVPILVVLLLSPFLIAANGGPAGSESTSTGTGVVVTDASGNGYHQWADVGSAWINGALNDSKGTYREGTPVPYRLVLMDLPAGNHVLVGEYQYAIEQNKKKAWAFAGISGYGSRAQDALPCVGCTTPAASPQVFGGTNLGLTEATIDGQYRRFTLTFTTAAAGTVVVAWGGMLAVPDAERGGPASISGAAYHMKLVSLDGTTLGSMDLQLQASALLAVDDPEPDGDGGCPDGTQLSDDGTTCVTPPPACDGTITATMRDGADNRVAGTVTPDDGGPALTVNDTTGSTATCGSYSYTATAPSGWQFVSGTTNPQTAKIDTDGQTVTLAWTVEKQPCAGTITAAMRDGAGNDVDGGSLTASDDAPTVTLNGGPTTVTCDPTTTDPTHTYTATAPSGWQFVSGTTNPQTAQIDTDGQTVTLTWTVEQQPLTCPSGTVPSEDGTTCVQSEGAVGGGDPVVEEEEVVEEEQDPVIVDDPNDPVVVEDPVLEDGEAVCEGGLGLRVTDLLGEPVPGASVALGDETHSLTSGQHDETLPCGSVEVELTSIPGGYVFVRTEIHGTSTLSAQSTHTKSRKVSAVVSDDASSTVVFVVDPLEVMPEEITEPAPERDPLGAPHPAPAQDDPQPAPQPAPVEPVAAPTLPRTGIPAGRLLTLAILMLTAGGAMLGSRRSVDR